MGSSQSTRRLTISNEEEAGVIRVSNTLIQRLAANSKDPAVTQKTTEVRPSLETQSSGTPQPPVQMPLMKDASGREVYYCTDLTLSALQTQQQKEQEIERLNEHWQKNLEKLEENYKNVITIMDDEYTKALEEYQSGKKTVNIGNSTPPCQETSAKVLKCYQDHPKEILKCYGIVEEFSKCVDQCRTNVIATRC